MMRVLGLVLGLMLVSVSIGAEPAPWPQFRGPGGVGVADGQNLPTTLGPDMNVKWKVPVPPGMSSPVVVGGKLILTAFEDGKLYTIAYNRADGKEVWRKEAPAAKIEPFHATEGSPAASTPATDGERVVVYFGSCGLFCYDLDGKQLWEHPMPCAETNNDFGTGTSPVLADGKVVLLRDLSKDSKLIALDAKTGKIDWEVKRDGFTTSYSSPCIWQTDGGKQVVVPGHLRLISYDLADGKEKWSYNGLPAVTCTTPIVADGKLIYAGWSPGGSEFKMPAFDDILKQAGEVEKGYLTKDGCDKTMLKGFFSNNDTNKDGKITRDEWETALKFLSNTKNIAVSVKPGATGTLTAGNLDWSLAKGLPYVPSPLVYKDRMYTINMQGRMSSIDIKTGKPAYELVDIGLTGSIYASPVASDGHIYVCGLDRSVRVIEAGGTEPDKVSSTKLDERISATPAIADQTLFIRTGKTLYAFAAPKK